MANLYGLLASAAVNLFIGINCVLLFSYLRRKPAFKWLYQPRVLNVPHLHAESQKPIQFGNADTDSNNQFDLHLYKNIAPFQIPHSLFGWVSAALYPNEQDLLAVSGLDAVMLCRFFSIGFKIFALGTMAMFMLIPINLSAKPHYHVQNIDMLSISNVPSGDLRLVAHLIIIYMLTFLVFYFVRETWKDYVLLRHRFLVEQHSRGRHFALLVQSVSKDTDSEMFRNLYCGLYGDQIYDAWLLKDTDALRNCISKRDKCLRRLESALQILADSGRRPTKRVCMSKIDAIEYYSSEVNFYDLAVSSLLHDGSSNLCTGIVMFKSTLSLYTARTLYVTSAPMHYISKIAPEPEDVYYPALFMSYDLKYWRHLLVTATVWMMILLWSLPVVFAQSFSNIEEVAKSFPVFQPLLSLGPVMISLLEGMLPSTIIVLFMLVLPVFLLALSKMEGIEAKSWLQISLLEKHFLFQIINFMLISSVAGSVLGIVDDLVHQPATAIELLGTSLPRNGLFFISYILLRSLTVFPIQLLRIPDFLAGVVGKGFRHQTSREAHELHATPSLQYGADYAEHLLVMLIGLIYATIAPIILPFAALFFAVGYVTIRYQLLYVYNARWESGGRFWRAVSVRILVGLAVSQLTMAGVFGLKDMPMLSTLTLPLPFITYLFWQRLRDAYEYKSEYLSIQECKDVDARLRARASPSLEAMLATIRKLYTQPELLAPTTVCPNLSDDHPSPDHVSVVGAASRRARAWSPFSTTTPVTCSTPLLHDSKPSYDVM